MPEEKRELPGTEVSKLSIQGHIVSIFGSVGHMALVATPQLSYCSMKAAMQDA